MKKNATAAVVAAAMLATPGMAFAAEPAVTGEDVAVTALEDGSGAAGTTMVTWEADDAQLDITVPNTIHVVAKADGELMVPTNATITNNSVFSVHGTKYVTADAGITLVESTADADGSDDTIEMQVTATGAAMNMGPAGEHAIEAGNLNLNKAGLDGNATILGLAGKVKLANDPATVPTDAFTIEWHFQAGLNEPAEVLPFQGVAWIEKEGWFNGDPGFSLNYENNDPEAAKISGYLLDEETGEEYHYSGMKGYSRPIYEGQDVWQCNAVSFFTGDPVNGNIIKNGAYEKELKFIATTYDASGQKIDTYEVPYIPGEHTWEG